MVPSFETPDCKGQDVRAATGEESGVLKSSGVISKAIEAVPWERSVETCRIVATTGQFRAARVPNSLTRDSRLLTRACYFIRLHGNLWQLDLVMDRLYRPHHVHAESRPRSVQPQGPHHQLSRGGNLERHLGRAGGGLCRDRVPVPGVDAWA